ncbi:hypothetical protein HanPI659440_Chr11g0436491 [Helianthus annuus]|uniref:Uncharacterized protein n=1 Tax=Helianthus annuus TaxID=4232 RepID=A0A251T0J3_HELAN|nr:hypothetical protein HanPI659440_Chr11g0436491 [Helianthus annuus]
MGSLKPTSICEQIHSIDGVSPWLLIIHLLRLASVSLMMCFCSLKQEYGLEKCCAQDSMSK